MAHNSYLDIDKKFYKEMDKMFKELGINLEDTDDKEKIKKAENFISTFSPEKLPFIKYN